MSGEANPTTEAATTPTEAKASISRIEELEGPGELSEPAFAALFGVNSDDNENGDWSKAVSIPINSPNVVLGRDHNKITEKNFVSLGKNTSLSRYHVRIFCRDIRGGRLDIDGNTGKWKYNDEDASSSRSATKVPVGADDQEEYFQGGACGSFAIEVVGKNPITVNRRPLHRGQVALLKHRTPLQIAVWSLYFLLPDPCSEDAGQQKDNTINAPNPALESFKKKRKMGEVNTTSGAEIKRKKLLSTASVGSNFGHVSTASGVRLAYSVELESMSLDELLDRMTEAIFNNQWSRKEQMIGTTICLRAVQQAAASPEIQEIARREGGVNRMDVIKWIENNPKYHKWRKQMLSKMVGACSGIIYEY